MKVGVVCIYECVLKGMYSIYQSGQSVVQKKAYGCLQVVLSGTGHAHTRFLEGHLDQLKCLLVDSLSTVSAGSKKVRQCDPTSLTTLDINACSDCLA